MSDDKRQRWVPLESNPDVSIVD